jgi:hypothetical protein
VITVAIITRGLDEDPIDSALINQEPDLDTVQTATTVLASSNTQVAPKRKGRQPGSKNKKTLQRAVAIQSAMQALQAGGTQLQRDEAFQGLQAALLEQNSNTQAIQAQDGSVTQGKKRGRPVGSKNKTSRKKAAPDPSIEL